jgi:hypothetical protein
MSNSNLTVDPLALYKTSEKLETPAEAIYRAKQHFLTGMSGIRAEPWGDDEIGHAFADGKDGYVVVSAEILKSIDNLITGLGNVTDKVKLTADQYVKTEYLNSQ